VAGQHQAALTPTQGGDHIAFVWAVYLLDADLEAQVFQPGRQAFRKRLPVSKAGLTLLMEGELIRPSSISFRLGRIGRAPLNAIVRSTIAQECA